MNPSISHNPANSPLQREQYLRIVRSAIAFREFRFARRAISDWLSTYQGDLPFRYQYAYALYKEGHMELAIPILEELGRIDPEYLEPLETMLRIMRSGENRGISAKGARQPGIEPEDCYEWIRGLKGEHSPGAKAGATKAGWGRAIYLIRKSLQNDVDLPNNWQTSEDGLLKVLAAKPGNPLVAVVHLEWLRAKHLAGETPAGTLNTLAGYYHKQFPDCLQCALVKVECLLTAGQHENAVALLHLCASRDITGQVARRLWGNQHPYQTLWPDKLEGNLGQGVPASVAAYFGWNRLAEGDQDTIVEATEPVEATQVDEPDAYPTQEISLQPDWLKPITEADAAREPLIKEATPEGAGPYTSTPKAALGSIPEADLASEDGLDNAVITEQTRGGPSLSPDQDTAPHEFSIPDVTLPEQLRQVQEELNRIGNRLRRPDLANADGRQPVYVIMTCLANLEKSVGADQAAEIEIQLLRLLKVMQDSTGWRTTLFYADKGVCLPNEAQISKPSKPNDPWGLKLALVDLDTLLRHNGEMVGCVLIVGGNEIVPFHKLPNPVDDSDEEVPSDNPYATRDENYFVPEWPVGRLPSAQGDNGELMFRLIHNLFAAYSTRQPASSKSSGSWMQALWRLAQFFIPGFSRNGHAQKNFGYTAAAWRFASFGVFKIIGDPKDMLISPPRNDHGKSRPTKSMGRQYVQRGKKDAVRVIAGEMLARTPGVIIPPAKLGYFNLHGLPNAVEWYGQSDPGEAGYQNNGSSEYPVALQPGDIGTDGAHAPQVVFSEACYGANILKKSLGEAMVYRFMERGTLAFVGSTCVSYGAVNLPMTAADYLGSLFWLGIRQGYTAGVSLQRAKISLAGEMHRRNGYLDGEDQKTLISFVLYGDPFAQPLSPTTQAKGWQRSQKRPPVPEAICDHSLGLVDARSINPETLRRVKQLVEDYLPGMRGARLSLRNEQCVCHQNCAGCRMKSSIKAKGNSNSGGKEVPLPERQVVILSKHTSNGTKEHDQFARITLDGGGNVIKMVVSR